MRATYRLQLGPGFGFAEARERVPYLRELGVSHLYLSPSFQARAGSTHGYDVIDPTRISEDLGGEEGFRALAAAAHGTGLGIVLDIVPNHMATDDENRFWADPALRAKFFDIDPETGRHRRFFDIDHLAGVRVEDPEVFEVTHALALRLVGEGLVDGLRIDHPDGLADPAGYLERLRDRGVPHVWVEKIVDPGERLRATWPVDGTTGYEFLNDVAALFVDPAAEARFTAAYAELTGEARPFGDVAHEAKLEQASTTFAQEVAWLERLWPRVPADVTAAVCALPVYRTYLGERAMDPDDRAVLAEAGLSWLRDAPVEFVTRFQQTTPPIMAKGVEDTAFYRYGRFLALNDVGGDPSRFGIPVDAFHAGNAERAARWPGAMLTLQTHDTKRSADVRARLVALSWLADDFLALARTVLADAPAPDAAEGWFFLQTVVAAPLEADRLRAYVEKALRERKLTSTWAAPDEAHERATADWTVALLDRADVRAFADRLAGPGRQIAAAQKLLQLTAPGVPDVYQGDEDELLALVDPDNRRPVDWAALRTEEPSEKLALTRAALALDLVGLDYTPLPVGSDAVAYLRGGDVLVATPVRGTPVELALPRGRWLDAVTDEPVDGTILLDRPRLFLTISA
jgi:(1->4)-alpha-D-glucan 1-alpha-D-glucosylmutase